MAGWLLAITRDTELARGLAGLLLRAHRGHQLWAAEDLHKARRRLGGTNDRPGAIVLDELFLRGEPLRPVAEELTRFAPLIVIARPSRQSQLAPLVATGAADFVSRDDNYIPLALALAERTLLREQRAGRQSHETISAPSRAAANTEYDGHEAARLVGGILDNLGVAFAERSQLPRRLACRLDRATDLAFELQHSLRRAGQSERARDLAR